MTKVELRANFLEKRKTISEAEYQQLNRAVYERFFTFSDLSFVKVLHCFLPITSKREVDTWLIIDRIRREYPHIRLSIPRINKETDRLENFFFEGLHQLKTNSWGIKEPKQGVPTESEKIDLVLVPLLTFDITGHRIGYGKGYYDKFLALCRPDCNKVGLSLFAPIEKILEEPQDIKLNCCVTPEKVYTFN